MSSDSPQDGVDQPDELARLPHGRHGLPPEFVAENQRQRLLVALINVVAERGYNETTITRIIEGAGITSRTFYKYFGDVESCYLAAFDAAAELLADRLEEAWDPRVEWPARIRAALAAALDFFVASPELARLCLGEPIVAGPAISGRYREQIERLVPFLREGRELRPTPAPIPETTERGLLGSIASQIARKTAAGEAEALPEMLPDLAQFLLTPYLGAAEARQIAQNAA